jgi:hypothetical protein
MRWLIPRIAANQLPFMLKTALVGAVIAGTYGALHDQVSYALSPEYFTKFKAYQFAWAKIGLPPRLFALEVGLLATWWVGLVAGWLLTRAGLVELPVGVRLAATARAFGIITGFAILGGLIGGMSGAVVSAGDLTAWAEWQNTLNLDDLPGFVLVAYLHAGGYLGALLGLIVAIVDVRRSQHATNVK